MILPSPRSRFVSLGDPLIWAGTLGLATQSIDISPPVICASATVTLTITGVGTSWTVNPPTFTPTGVAGVTVLSVGEPLVSQGLGLPSEYIQGFRASGAGSGPIVIDDTHAVIVVSTSGSTGTVTWTDSSTGATGTQVVQICRAQAYVVPLSKAYWMEDFR